MNGRFVRCLAEYLGRGLILGFCLDKVFEATGYEARPVLGELECDGGVGMPLGDVVDLRRGSSTQKGLFVSACRPVLEFDLLELCWPRLESLKCS